MRGNTNSGQHLPLSAASERGLSVHTLIVSVVRSVHSAHHWLLMAQLSIVLYYYTSYLLGFDLPIHNTQV